VEPSQQSRQPLAGGQAYWWIVLGLTPLAILFASSRPWGYGFDFWETAAAVRELSIRPLHPQNPIVPLPGDTSPRFVPYTLAWGIFMRVTGLGIFPVMAAAAMLNFLVFVTGLYRFISGHFRDRTLPACLLPIMLICWASGYFWANAYHLEIFLLTLPYVGFGCFALSLHALRSFDLALATGRRTHLTWYGLLAIFIYVSHPLSGLFCFAAATALGIATARYRWTGLTQLVPVVALAASLAWPYFRYADIYDSGTSEEWFTNELFTGQVRALGPALWGLLPLGLYAARRRRMFLVYGFAICAAVYLASWAAKIEIGGRFIFFATFFLHLALASFLRDCMGVRAVPRGRLAGQAEVGTTETVDPSCLSADRWVGSRPGRYALLAVTIAAITLPALPHRLTEMRRYFGGFFESPAKFPPFESPSEPFLFLADYLDSTDIVLAHPTYGWFLPAITGAKVVAPLLLSPLAAAEGRQRQKDTLDFLGHSGARVTPQAKLEMLQRHRATHVLVVPANRDAWDPALIDQLNEWSEPPVSNGALTLYPLQPAGDRKSGPLQVHESAVGGVDSPP
jgi:hypothetical protein